MNTVGQGTTPYLQVAIEGYDLSDAAVIHVTIEQGNPRQPDHKLLDLTGERVTVVADEEGSVVTAHLTQEETLGLRQGFAELQVRWRDQYGEAFEIEVITVNILKALYKGVI